MSRSAPALLGAALLLSLGGRPAEGQVSELDPGRHSLSRPGLEELLSAYERAARSPVYSEAMRAEAAREGALIRLRLEEGDFQVGDQLMIAVQGEAQLTGTFTVEPGPNLMLPDIGAISLRGVLRSELEEHLAGELERFIRDPVVDASTSIRVLVTGGVAKAGYHVFASTDLLSGVLMAAGGPLPDAAIDRMRIERGGNRIWEGESLQRAVVEGRTLDQMSLRAGDRIVVPVEDGSRGAAGIVRSAVMGVLPLIAAAATLARIF